MVHNSGFHLVSNVLNNIFYDTLYGVFKMDANDKKVLAAMKKIGKPVRPGDIVEFTGLDKKDVSTSFKALKSDGVICSPKRCYYEPSV